MHHLPELPPAAPADAIYVLRADALQIRLGEGAVHPAQRSKLWEGDPLRGAPPASFTPSSVTDEIRTVFREQAHGRTHKYSSHDTLAQETGDVGTSTMHAQQKWAVLKQTIGEGSDRAVARMKEAVVPHVQA